MQKADRIIHNATILTMDSDFRIVEKGALVVNNDEITFIGSEQEVLKNFSATKITDVQGKTILPGIINAHTHAPMTLLRGLADDRRLDVWLLGYMMPVEREFVSPDFCRLGTEIACAEMIRSGVTCFVDMYYFEETIAEATAAVGLRAICGETIMKYPTPDADCYEDALAYTRAFIERWKNHPLITPCVAPHAAYTCTPEILKACTNLALEYDVPLHIHISETIQEVDSWRDEYAMPVVPWIKKLNLFATKTIAAHCVHIDDGEIRTLEHAGVGIAHNPSSNMKLASGFAPVLKMRQSGLNVGIGTDGTASNNDLDMFEEIRLANFIAKGSSGDPTALPARDTLAMATIEGARAIHMDHLIGSIEPGKKADLIVLDLDTLHNSPYFSHDPNTIYSRIIYAAKSNDISDVMVNGKWLMRDKNLLTVDEVQVKAAAQQYAVKIDTFISKREGSVLSKLIAIGGAEQEESYEVQIKVRIPERAPVAELLDSGAFEIVRKAHYKEYDTYFTFDEIEQGRLRYREDEFIDADGEVYKVRNRLTLTGPAAEHEYSNSVLLSRSRFIAAAQNSLRFYREYFKPESEIEISKDRLRWLIRFKNEEFFINLDKIIEPAIDDHFLEIKSRTWSRRDAEQKAVLIKELLDKFGTGSASPGLSEYVQLVNNS